MFGCLCLSSGAVVPTLDPLLEVAHAFTPRVQAVAPDALLLDLTGLGRSWPQPMELAKALAAAAAARALAARVALSWSRTAALMLARAQPGPTVVAAGQEAAAVAPLPLTALLLAPARLELFRRWGLRTLGELAALPAEGLAARLGTEGPRLLRLARGEDDRPLVAEPPPESFACTLELDWPVDGLEPLAFLLTRVLEPLCATLAARCRRAAALTLELALVDGTRHARTLRPSAPAAEARTWRTLLLLDLEAHPPADAVQALTVSAEPTLARVVQFSLLDPAQPSPERLAETLARLHEWTAGGRSGAATLLDSHRPGAFAVSTFGPGPFRPGNAVAAEAGPRLALRAFRPPLPARVTLKDGAPAVVSAAGLYGAVTQCAGPWRASGDWWDTAWSREEWDVALSGRGFFRIYRDRLQGTWFVDAELD